jgi:hypothetical protein
MHTVYMLISSQSSKIFKSILIFLILIFYFRFDRDTIPDRFGDKDIENEIYVNKNILRPTRRTRDQIELLACLKYRDAPKRYSGKSKNSFLNQSLAANNQTKNDEPLKKDT